MNKLLATFTSLSILFSAGAIAHDLNRGVEGRFAVFFPFSSTYRHIYGIFEPAFALEAFGKIKGPALGWTNLEWRYKNGDSIGAHKSTHVNILNWSFGAKFAFRVLENYYPYFGLGPNVSTVWVSNHSHCAKGQAKTGFGFVVKSGVYYTFSRRLYLDFFADYLYQHIHFRKNANVGGLNIGAGLGVKF